MNDIRLSAIKSFNEFNEFINEVLRINPRIYRVEDYTRGFIEAMSNHTYLETVSKLNYPSVDSYYRYINKANNTMFKEVYKSFVKNVFNDLKKL
ncbi:protein of unknown function [Methanocaldococcus lauensis]|nr:protein of unknown function [Methanocaldococcus lauensis]